MLYALYKSFNSVRALPYFLSNLLAYRRHAKHSPFVIRMSALHYCTGERFETAGGSRGHYFHPDILAAACVYKLKPSLHVDIGSRLDGFVAHLLPFCRVESVDIRPLGSVGWPNLVFRRGSIVDLPYADKSIESLSCLHVIEHIGLGRYGDPIDPEGHIKAALEMARVLGLGGRLLIGTPVGRQRLCFDAHRIFDPQTIVDIFSPLRLLEFALINDQGGAPEQQASFESARACSYGCGLFMFSK